MYGLETSVTERGWTLVTTLGRYQAADPECIADVATSHAYRSRPDDAMAGREEAEPMRLREPRLGSIPSVLPAPFFTEQLESRLLPEYRQRINDDLDRHAFGLMQLRPALDGSR